MVTKETKLLVAIALVSAMYGREQWAQFQTYNSAHPFDTLAAGMG